MENATSLRPPPPPLPPPFFTPLPPPSNFTNSIAPGPPPTPGLILPIDNSNVTFVLPPPAFPDDSNSVDLTPLEFILALMAVVTIPALIYAYFFSIKCPSWSSRRDYHHNSSDEFSMELSREVSAGSGPGGGDRGAEQISGVKYEKESHVKEIGSECPVCLSVFADGEEVRQLSGCKHAFHATCIDLWLNNHSNCPICRAVVAGKKPNETAPPPPPPRRREREDLHQGLPDASNLV